MICSLILLALTSGAGLSWGATCASLHAVALERCGGALLVVGLLLLGAALPLLG